MIVCAAIKLASGEVRALARPARHAHILQLVYRETGDMVRGEEQGFLACSMCGGTSECREIGVHGFFLRRPQAERHAREVGQLQGEPIGSVLTSEDLW